MDIQFRLHGIDFLWR